jgi:hypothetical protein
MSIGGWAFFAKYDHVFSHGVTPRESGLSALSAGVKPLSLYCHIESVEKAIELDIWSLGFLW